MALLFRLLHCWRAASDKEGPAANGGAVGDDGPSAAAAAHDNFANNSPPKPERGNDTVAPNITEPPPSDEPSPYIDPTTSSNNLLQSTINDDSAAAANRKNDTRNKTTKTRIQSRQRPKKSKKRRHHRNPKQKCCRHHQTPSSNWMRIIFRLFCLLFVLASCVVQCVGAATSGASAVAVGTVRLVSSTISGTRKRTRSSNTSSTSSSSQSSNDGSSTKHTKKARKRARAKSKAPILSDDEVDRIIAYLEQCAGRKDIWIMDHARRLLKSGTTNPIKKVTVKFLLLHINEDLSPEQFRKEVTKLKKELKSEFLPEFWDQINLGDCLSPKTVLLFIKNYAPWSCLGKEGLRGVYNRISRTNACILQYWKVLPRSLFKEAGGNEWSDDLADTVGEHISFIDLHLFVPRKKKTYVSEFKEFARRHKVTVEDLKFVTFVFYTLHVKYFQLIHGVTKVLTVAAASVPANNDFFGGNCDGFKNNLVFNVGLLPHGECVATRRIARYSDEVLAMISKRLQMAFAAVADVVDDYVVPPPEKQSEIAERFSGRIGMSKEERDTWLESILEACRKGGRASAKLLEEAANLVAQLVEDELCNSYEEALDLIGFFLSTNHRNRWEGSQMAKVATKLVNEQVKKGNFTTPDEAIDWIKSNFGDKGESYANAWEGVHMASIANDYVEELKMEGKCKTYAEIIEAIKRRFGDKGESYANAWEQAHMVPIANDYVEELKMEGKCKTYAETIEAIKRKFGDKGESYARRWAQPHMLGIANEFVEEQKMQGKCKTYAETIEAIKRKFCTLGESYAAKWADAVEAGVVDFLEEHKKQGKCKSDEEEIDVMKDDFLEEHKKQGKCKSDEEEIDVMKDSSRVSSKGVIGDTSGMFGVQNQFLPNQWFAQPQLYTASQPFYGHQVGCQHLQGGYSNPIMQLQQQIEWCKRQIEIEKLNGQLELCKTQIERLKESFKSG